MLPPVKFEVIMQLTKGLLEGEKYRPSCVNWFG
jgi:hypothetical protein